jgi:hypothetical protein
MIVMVYGMILLCCIASIEYISFAADLRGRNSFSAKDTAVLAQFPHMVTDLCALKSVDHGYVWNFFGTLHEFRNGKNNQSDVLYCIRHMCNDANLSPQTFLMVNDTCEKVLRREPVVLCVDRYNPEKEQENKWFLINRMPSVLKHLCERNPDEYYTRMLIFMTYAGTQNLCSKLLFMPQDDLNRHIEYVVGKKIGGTDHPLLLSPQTILQLVDEFKDVALNGSSVPFHPYNKDTEKQQISTLVNNFPTSLGECYTKQKQDKQGFYQWYCNRLTCVAYMLSHDLVGNLSLESACSMLIADKENSYKRDLVFAITWLTGYNENVADVVAQQFIDIFRNQWTQGQLSQSVVLLEDKKAGDNA